MNKEIENWIDNFEETSQSVADLEQAYENEIMEQARIAIRRSEGLDWKSISYMLACLYVDNGITCASRIEGYGEDE